MAGINVLSDTLKAGSKLVKTPASKGKDAPDSPENAATAFATMLSGSINRNVDPKGQSSKASQDSDEKQSAEDPVQNTQIPNELGSMLGYGHFALSNFFQPMLQSNLPAGKEANSGNDVGQGTVGLALLNLVSLASDEVSAQSGMTTLKPQGDNPGITELDKYRQVIANLLVALSGEITDNSPMGIPSGPESSGTKGLSQDMTKIIQGWMTVTDDVIKDGQAMSGQKGIQSLLEGLSNALNNRNPELNAKVSTLLASIYTKLNLGGEGVGGDSIDPLAKGSSEPVLKQTKVTDLNPLSTQVKDTVPLTNVQQKLEGIGPQENKTLRIIEGTFKEEVQKGTSTPSSELSGVKDVQSPNPGAGIGLASNILATNVADGKTVSIPVLEQIATVFREQVTNRHQELKDLDIQLHPADLGKIQINLRWENGQVHLQVQASEAATGQLLQKQLSELRQTLSNQGVNCGMLEMGQGRERQQNSNGNKSQMTFNQNILPNEDEDPIQVTNSLSIGRDNINQINVTA
ncbi:MAG TPA: flagellar hook-length control protein FliK [Desulfosporosinus sp.]